MFHKNQTISILSFTLAGLLIFSSSVGLFSENFYSKETANWQAQSIGQDMIDLFLVVPSLILTALLARRKLLFLFIWAGVVSYVVYTFLIFCFSVHFNQLFIIYCFVLGLSVYSLVYFLTSLMRRLPGVDVTKTTAIKITGIYFLVISIGFYLLWLSEIFSALAEHKLPDSLAEAGLITNPVHVIDLSVCLPAIFITGFFILKKKTLGYLMGIVTLSFLILMNITIGSLIVIMKVRGLEDNLSVAYAMFFLAIGTSVLLFWFGKSTELR
jgi:hypothetical protein